MSTQAPAAHLCLWVNEGNADAIGELMDEYQDAGWEMEIAELIGEDGLVILGLWEHT